MSDYVDKGHSEGHLASHYLQRSCREDNTKGKSQKTNDCKWSLADNLMHKNKKKN